MQGHHSQLQSKNIADMHPCPSLCRRQSLPQNTRTLPNLTEVHTHEGAHFSWGTNLYIPLMQGPCDDEHHIVDHMTIGAVVHESGERLICLTSSSTFASVQSIEDWEISKGLTCLAGQHLVSYPSW